MIVDSGGPHAADRCLTHLSVYDYTLIATKCNKYLQNTTKCNKKPEEIKICIDVMQANYLRTLPLHPSQEEIERNDDYSIFRFHMVPSYEFVQELRKYGPDLTVLAPNDLREQFEEEAEMLRSNYSREESWV